MCIRDRAVLYITHEAARQHRGVMLDRGVLGKQVQRIAEQLARRLEGAEHHPDDGKHDDYRDEHGKNRKGNAYLLFAFSHQVSPPLLTLNWAYAISANTIITTVEIADA